MTSDSNPPEPPRESPMQGAMGDAKAAFEKSGFAAPEGMVALGSLVLLGSWVLFNFILEWYGYMGHLAMMAAIVAVALYFGRAPWASSIASRAALMKAAGWVIAIMGAVELLWAIRYFSIDGADEIIPLLTYMAGYVLAFLGARQIEV